MSSSCRGDPVAGFICAITRDKAVSTQGWKGIAILTIGGTAHRITLTPARRQPAQWDRVRLTSQGIPEGGPHHHADAAAPYKPEFD